MVPLVIGVVAAAVIMLAVILGLVIIIIRSIKHPPKQTGESTFDSSKKLELTAVHSAGSMLEIDNSYYASAGQKHDSNKNDHTYSVIESGTTQSGDGNPAPLYASIEEKVEIREGSSTSEDIHIDSVVNEKLTKENESHTSEGQDESHVYSVVKEETDKAPKELCTPDESHVYSVVNEKEKSIKAMGGNLIKNTRHNSIMIVLIWGYTQLAYHNNSCRFKKTTTKIKMATD